MERGEVEGICESYDSVKIRRPEWIATRRIMILFQGGAANGEHLAALVAKIYATPKPIVDRITSLIK
jgi:hypothetical protein